MSTLAEPSNESNGRNGALPRVPVLSDIEAEGSERRFQEAETGGPRKHTFRAKPKGEYSASVSLASLTIIRTSKPLKNSKPVNWRRR